jgi:hypothetical protein
VKMRNRMWWTMGVWTDELGERLATPLYNRSLSFLWGGEARHAEDF